MNPIDIALRIATSAHAGQLDRDGYPVILHPLTVGLMAIQTRKRWQAFIPNRFHMRAYVNSSSGFMTRNRPMMLVLIWGHNTAAVSSIVMNLRSRQPNM